MQGKTGTVANSEASTSAVASNSATRKRSGPNGRPVGTKQQRTGDSARGSAESKDAAGQAVSVPVPAPVDRPPPGPSASPIPDRYQPCRRQTCRSGHLAGTDAYDAGLLVAGLARVAGRTFRRGQCATVNGGRRMPASRRFATRPALSYFRIDPMKGLA